MSAEKTLVFKPESNALIAGLHDVRAQLMHILNALSPQQYTHAIPGHSSIGAHCRHSIEFMQALQNGGDEVNYDNRQRNLEVETSIEIAKKSLEEVVTHIGHMLDKQCIAHPVSMVEKLSTAYDSTPVPSTLGREIAYVVQHGVHHIFMIKTLAQMQGIELDGNLGVAPATLAYQGKQCAHSA